MYKQALASPWDIVHFESNRFFIANAGSHQIWELDYDSEILKRYAGSGSEANQNSKSDLRKSAWA